MLKAVAAPIKPCSDAILDAPRPIARALNPASARTVRWLFLLTLAPVAVFLLGFSAWLTLDRSRVLATFRQADGEVLTVRVDGSPQARWATSVIEVRYKACPEPPPEARSADPFRVPQPLGRLLNDKSSECVPGERAHRRSTVRASGPTFLAPGDRVTVLWHPDQPRRIFVHSFSAFWFEPFMLAVFGAPLGWAVMSSRRDVA